MALSTNARYISLLYFSSLLTLEFDAIGLPAIPASDSSILALVKLVLPVSFSLPFPFSLCVAPDSEKDDALDRGGEDDMLPDPGLRNESNVVANFVSMLKPTCLKLCSSGPAFGGR